MQVYLVQIIYLSLKVQLEASMSGNHISLGIMLLTHRIIDH